MTNDDSKTVDIKQLVETIRELAARLRNTLKEADRVLGSNGG